MNEGIRVAEALDRGEIPWRLPAFPRNVRSGKPYGGVSPIMLNIAAGALGCSSPWWGTIAEWAAVGSKVPFGLGAWLPGCKQAVYNLESTDRAYEPPLPPQGDPDTVFDAIVKGLGVKIEYGFDATCKYYGADDRIRMPHRWMFEIGAGGISGWYDAAFHELIHGSEPRLRWDGHPDVSELRAEIGSGYVCGLLDVAPLPLHLRRHHDAHLARWIRLMRDDPRLPRRVCESATEAVSYLLRFAGQEIRWHSSEA